MMDVFLDRNTSTSLQKMARLSRLHPTQQQPEGTQNGKIPSKLGAFIFAKTEREDYALKSMDHDWIDGGLCASWIVRLWQSTLLNIISGLHPSQGRILFNDKDVTMAPTTQRNIAQVSRGL
jgi:hypothetical protein